MSAKIEFPDRLFPEDLVDVLALPFQRADVLDLPCEWADVLDFYLFVYF